MLRFYGHVHNTTVGWQIIKSSTHSLGQVSVRERERAGLNRPPDVSSADACRLFKEGSGTTRTKETALSPYVTLTMREGDEGEGEVKPNS